MFKKIVDPVTGHVVLRWESGWTLARDVKEEAGTSIPWNPRTSRSSSSTWSAPSSPSSRLSSKGASNLKS